MSLALNLVMGYTLYSLHTERQHTFEHSVRNLSGFWSHAAQLTSMMLQHVQQNEISEVGRRADLAAYVLHDSSFEFQAYVEAVGLTGRFPELFSAIGAYEGRLDSLVDLKYQPVQLTAEEIASLETTHHDLQAFNQFFTKDVLARGDSEELDQQAEALCAVLRDPFVQRTVCDLMP